MGMKNLKIIYIRLQILELFAFWVTDSITDG